MKLAARRQGNIPGLAGIFDPAPVGIYIRQGMRMILSGIDLGLMMDGVSQRTATLCRLAT